MNREELLRGMAGGALGPDELETMVEGTELGEDPQRAHDRYLTRPRVVIPEDRVPAQKIKLPPMKPKVGPPKPAGVKVIPVVRTIKVSPNECVISNFQISNDKPYRVDLPLEYRTDILIANMSLSPVWINMHPNISPAPGQYVGVPLKAMSGPTGYDGGVCRLAVQANKRVWAISVAAGPHLVVVIETAIRA